MFALADRDISQSKLSELSAEWKFGIAYNAALQLATAILAASGFEAERQNKHMRTIECMPFSMAELSANDVRFLDRCRAKRHTSVYDEIGMISAQEAAEMAAFAEKLRTLTRAWFKREHPALLK